MKNRLLLSAAVLLLVFACAAPAAEGLVENGRGLRTKMILGAMYELELRVPADLKGAEAQTLIEANEPMEYVLTIRSGLINRKRYVHATTQGFAKAAKSGYTTDRQAEFLGQFDDTEFRKGDIIVMSYAPATGLSSTYRKQTAPDVFEDSVLATLPGLDLKQAVFAIWLGETPVQESLKQGLLGKP